MGIAFHLLTHRNPAQIIRLLDAVWHKENVYVLHHDRRRPQSEHAELANLVSRYPNLILQTPTPVLWGRYSLYAAQHEGLRLALARGHSWTHWINLSGQCEPLQSPNRFQRILADAGDTSFVRHFRVLENGDWTNPEKRVTRHYIDSALVEWWIRLPGIGRRLRRFLCGGENELPTIPGIKKALPTTFTWYGGDNWVVLSRAAGEYLTTSPDADRIISDLRHSGLPEESIFQSVLMNSPLASKVRNDHLRCINWLPGVGSPAIFKSEDFPRLQKAAANGALVARKFDARVDSAIIVRIRQELLVE